MTKLNRLATVKHTYSNLSLWKLENIELASSNTKDRRSISFLTLDVNSVELVELLFDRLSHLLYKFQIE